MAANIPLGWESRNNQMSEHDIKLGGAAANKFANKKLTNAYAEGAASYKTSEQVRSFYYAQQEQANDTTLDTGSPMELPAGWVDRQKSRQLEAKQYGVFSSKSQMQNGAVPVPVDAIGRQEIPEGVKKAEACFKGPEQALFKVTTDTLAVLADTLEQTDPRVVANLSSEEQAAFATAVRRVMNVLAKSKSK